MTLFSFVLATWALLPLGLLAPIAQGQPPASSETLVVQDRDSANSTPLSDFAKLRRELHFQLMQAIDRLDPYVPNEGLKGKIVLSGSTTMNDLEHRWARNLGSLQPQLELSVTSDGSEAALKALANDPKLVIGVSRPVDEADLKYLQAGKCKEPVAIVIGLEALAVAVHAKNPLDRITPETIKAIFAADKDGLPSAKNWSDVGVSGDLAPRPIQIYERDGNSGTSVFLSRSLLAGASLSKPFQICDSNNEICSRIANDQNGVGIADIHTSYASIRRLPVLVNGVVTEATEENVLLGRYPLIRPLLLVFDKQEMKDDNKLRESMIRYVLSRDGQVAVIGAGFFPLDAGFIQHQLNECVGQQLR